MGDRDVPASLTDVAPPRLAGWGWAAMLFVFVAVALEVLGGQYSNSQVSSITNWVVPLGWPQAARVVWWLTVAAAAATFRYAERTAGIRRNPILIVASVLPFVIFAIGIALGASFSTWH